MLQNLFTNAWKFTIGNPAARIELWRELRGEGEVFSVRDNGVGFEMAYAHKLFRPFERLHTEAAFQGTDIGLATVRRIVQRHGGEVWAEGIPGQGAIDALADLHAVLPQTALVCGVGQEVFRKRAVQIEERETVESGRVGVFDQEFDGRLVIQDHLCLDGGLALRSPAVLDQLPGGESGVGVAFQVAGCPGEIDQKAVQDGAAISAGRQSRLAGITHPAQLPP